MARQSKSISVIVPAYNKVELIERTLRSIRTSLEFHCIQLTHPKSTEIVVVCDGSTDSTPRIVEEFAAKSTIPVHLVRHSHRTSAGVARNSGARVANGELLMFCDADDLFFLPHVHLCHTVLTQPRSLASAKVQIDSDGKVATLRVPPHPVAAMRTGVKLEDNVKPFWKSRIENTIPLNLCVRRECHEFLEGFPGQTVPFNSIGGEDISYQNWLSTFFFGAFVPLETVTYLRYPGNWLDRQIEKFRTEPGDYSKKLSEDEKKAHRLRVLLERRQGEYLLSKIICDDWLENLFEFLNIPSVLKSCMTMDRQDLAWNIVEKTRTIGRLSPEHESLFGAIIERKPASNR